MRAANKGFVVLVRDRWDDHYDIYGFFYSRKRARAFSDSLNARLEKLPPDESSAQAYVESVRPPRVRTAMNAAGVEF